MTTKAEAQGDHLITIWINNKRNKKMARDLNQCNFIGRLGKDVELRYAASGDAIANFTIAVGESWKDKQTGQKQEKTAWVPIVMFGKLAEIAGQYLQKGSKVFISGKFQTRKWQDQSGADRYSTEVVVDGFSGQMQMLDAKPEGGQNPVSQQAPQQAPQAQRAPQQPAMNQQQPNPANFQPQAPMQDGFSDPEIPF